MIVYYSLYMNSINCIVWVYSIGICIIYTVQCTLYIVLIFKPNNVHCSMSNLYMMYNELYTYCTLYNVHIVHCTIIAFQTHNTQYY